MSEQLEEDFIFKKDNFVHGVCVCALTYVPVDLPMCLTVTLHFGLGTGSLTEP